MEVRIDRQYRRVDTAEESYATTDSSCFCTVVPGCLYTSSIELELYSVPYVCYQYEYSKQRSIVRGMILNSTSYH